MDFYAYAYIPRDRENGRLVFVVRGRAVRRPAFVSEEMAWERLVYRWRNENSVRHSASEAFASTNSL